MVILNKLVYIVYLAMWSKKKKGKVYLEIL